MTEPTENQGDTPWVVDVQDAQLHHWHATVLHRVNLRLAPGDVLGLVELATTDLRGLRALHQDDRPISSLPMDRIASEFTALRRPIAPADYTGHYVLLASRANSLTVTGSVHICDGGVAVKK